MTWLQRRHGHLYLAVSLILLLWTALINDNGLSVTLVILVLGVVLLGLPHGALDTRIAPKTFGGWRYYSQAGFTLLYVFVSTVYGLLWWWQPTATLASFLVLSAWHFASDWADTQSWTASLGYGFAVVCLPAVAHRDAVNEVFLALGAQDISLLLDIMATLGPVAALVGIVGALQSKSAQRQKLVELGMILLTAILLPPLLYFVAYFCFLHSPRHLSASAQAIGIHDWSELLRSVGPAVAVCVTGGVVAWFLTPSLSNGSGVVSVIFVGLAVLTLPHMLLAWASTLAKGRWMARNV